MSHDLLKLRGSFFSSKISKSAKLVIHNLTLRKKKSRTLLRSKIQLFSILPWFTWQTAKITPAASVIFGILPKGFSQGHRTKNPSGPAHPIASNFLAFRYYHHHHPSSRKKYIEKHRGREWSEKGRTPYLEWEKRRWASRVIETTSLNVQAASGLRKPMACFFFFFFKLWVMHKGGHARLPFIHQWASLFDDVKLVTSFRTTWLPIIAYYSMYEDFFFR